MNKSSPEWNRRTPRQTDAVMLFALTVGALIALVQGNAGQQIVLATELGGACMLIGICGFAALRGTVWSRLLLTAAATGVVCSNLYLAGPRTEAYVGIFLFGSLLPQYRSWQLVLLTGTVLGAFVGVWAAGQAAHPDTSVVLCALAIQYAYLAYIAMCEERREAERFEIDFLIRAMGFDGPIRLNLDVLRADSRAGMRLKHVQQRMAEAIRQVQSSIDGVRFASEVLNQGSSELTSRTYSTATGLRDAAMCLEQINVIVKTSAQASMEARTMAARATDLAKNGGEQVKQVVDTIQAIAHSSSKITDIISVIDGIAFQTNILALNAAVEAARAGEQGKGFAVVAAEVRSLALRSSEAAKEIKSLISASLQTVECGVRQVSLTGNTMNDIVEAVRRVGDVFETLSADSNEHAGGIDVVTQSVKELDDVTQRNITVAEASSNIAAELMEHASRMTEVLSAFKLGRMPADDGMPARKVPTVSASTGTAPVAHVPKPVGNRPPMATSRSALSASAASASEGVEFF